jgi:hypothetical protein
MTAGGSCDSGPGLLRTHLHLHRSACRQLVSNGSDGEEICAGFEPVPRKAVLTLGIAHDSDGHRRARPLGADEYPFHRGFVLRVHAACQGGWR